MLSTTSSSQPSRKEWCAVSEHSIRKSGEEGPERLKLVQSDEVLRAGEPVGVDFSSITIDGGLSIDVMQQRILAVAKQRDELQRMEIKLHAQVITRSETVQMKNTFDMQIKEHANANSKLQEQLHEKEQKIDLLERKMDEKERELHEKEHKIHELERKMDEKERELNAIRFGADSAWTRDYQLSEQIKELKSTMREKINEKDSLLTELQKQHKIAQETIRFKEGRLREAHAWMNRAQEMDALQSSTNHNLQVELREHYNQLWLGCQRQSAEMKRLHTHLQQLQLELNDARGHSGVYVGGSSAFQTNFSNASELENSQMEVKVDASQNANISTLMSALHPFVMQQQGVPQPHVLQSHFSSVSAVSSAQNWPNQQPQLDVQPGPTHNQYPQEPEQNMLRTNALYGYETSGNAQILGANYSNANISRGLDAGSVSPFPNGEGQVLNSIDKTYDNNQSPQSLHQISSQFREALSLDTLEHGKSTKVEKSANQVSDNGIKIKNSISEHSNLDVNTSSFEVAANSKSISETDSASSVNLADNTLLAAGQKNNFIGKDGNSYLLDERALLAYIARAIGSGIWIRISTTLPNRLAKMLAPLHWHDYKKKYGKLDDFVARHLELFSIEGDYIQLREGAQQTIAATAAVAEVAAAAPSLYSSAFPTVSVTPMAQTKMASSLKSSYDNANKTRMTEFAGPKPNNGSKDHLEAKGSDYSQTKGTSNGRPGVRYQMGSNGAGIH